MIIILLPILIRRVVSIHIAIPSTIPPVSSTILPIFTLCAAIIPAIERDPQSPRMQL